MRPLTPSDGPLNQNFYAFRLRFGHDLNTARPSFVTPFLSPKLTQQGKCTAPSLPLASQAPPPPSPRRQASRALSAVLPVGAPCISMDGNGVVRLLVWRRSTVHDRGELLRRRKLGMSDCITLFKTWHSKYQAKAVPTELLKLFRAWMCCNFSLCFLMRVGTL